MSAVAWFGIILAGVIALIIAYYAFFLVAKTVITLLPAISVILLGGIIGWNVGSIMGGILFFISLVLAPLVHEKWESSDLYQKLEKYDLRPEK